MAKSNDYKLNLAVLRELYAAFDQLADEPQWACGAGCHVCCSGGRVLITTLEGRYLAQGLKQAGREDLLAKASSTPVDPAAQGASSMNALARMCLEHQEPPQALGPEVGGAQCPLLVDGLCPAYEHRPLACRSMVSSQVCLPGGEAVHDQWWVSVSTVFFQLVEAADPAGEFGPLAAVLAKVYTGEDQGMLAPCEPLPGLVVPPEHQARLQPILDQVFARQTAGRPLGACIDEIRTNLC